VWLFGSLARGDWDACSDVDLLAIAPTQKGADALAAALLEAHLGDDVLALSQQRWLQLTTSDDPYWRAIGSDALRLDRP
jgi:predicted nucleotidyltransferase